MQLPLNTGVISFIIEKKTLLPFATMEQIRRFHLFFCYLNTATVVYDIHLVKNENAFQQLRGNVYVLKQSILSLSDKRE